MGVARKFSQILDDKHVGKAARDLWKDAKNMLDKIKKDNLVEPKAVIGFWSANSIEDDVVIFENSSRKKNF